MWGQATRALLADGRDHWQHGPIDLIIELWGDAAAIDAVKSRAWQAFSGILPELARELTMLRLPLVPAGAGACDTRYPSPSPSIDEAVALSSAHPFSGVVAQRMRAACQPFSMQFITPMAAVAGSVAQELLQYYQNSSLLRTFINNGGDISIHLSPEQSVRVGVYANLKNFDDHQLASGVKLDGQFEIHSSSGVRGVATSGWRGRSFSLGIADSVTVLARTAAQADAAATVIANAVNLEDARIVRRSACDMKDDSDLGSSLVTVDVPLLPAELVQRALAAGLACASTLRARGLICSAVLVCQNQHMTTDIATQTQPAELANCS